MFFIINIELGEEKEEDVKKAWIRMPTAAIEDNRIGRVALTVLAVIIDRADTKACKASASELAEACGASLRAVKSAVKELEQAGYITVIRKPGEASTYMHNDVLPPKKRAQKKPAQQEQDKEPDYDTILHMWEESGYLKRLEETI